jgi:hypothetical protein
LGYEKQLESAEIRGRQSGISRQALASELLFRFLGQIGRVTAQQSPITDGRRLIADGCL